MRFTLAVYRPPWYPSWHPEDLTVTYHTTSTVTQPPTKRLRSKVAAVRARFAFGTHGTTDHTERMSTRKVCA